MDIRIWSRRWRSICMGIALPWGRQMARSRCMIKYEMVHGSFAIRGARIMLRFWRCVRCHAALLLQKLAYFVAWLIDIQLQWLPSTLHPHVITSISLDGRFKLWAEDTSQPVLNGRRFARAGQPHHAIRSQIPFLSFSLKHNPETRQTYLALLDRSGKVKVYENDEPENIDVWSDMDVFQIGPKPNLGEEVSARLRFDPNLEPSYNAIRKGVPRDSLGLVVAHMGTVTVWRTKLVTADVTLGAGSHKEFYRAAELKGHKGLVRDVAWAPGSVRGFDIVASVCKDGYVRIHEVTTPLSNKDLNGGYAKYPTTGQVVAHSQRAADGVARSGIGAGLATSRSGADSRQSDRSGQVHHEVKEVAKLDLHHGPVWRCDFDEDGQLLGTCGDDGRVILWRRKPDGGWAESGELNVARGPLPASQRSGNASQ